MGVVKTVLLVLFVLVCVLLVLLVLVQNEEDNGMGGVFGGGQSAAFGARSASVLTKTTGVLVALFFVIAFVVSLLNKPSGRDDLNEATLQIQGGKSLLQENTSWLEEELSPESLEQIEDDASVNTEVIESTVEDAKMIEIKPTEVQSELILQDTDTGVQANEGGVENTQVNDVEMLETNADGNTEDAFDILQESAESDEIFGSLGN